MNFAEWRTSLKLLYLGTNLTQKSLPLLAPFVLSRGSTRPVWDISSRRLSSTATLTQRISIATLVLRTMPTWEYAIWGSISLMRLRNTSKPQWRSPQSQLFCSLLLVLHTYGVISRELPFSTLIGRFPSTRKWFMHMWAWHVHIATWSWKKRRLVRYKWRWG